MTAKRGRGRVALPPGDKRRVKVSPHFTEGEAARLDAVRGEVERAEWLRAVAMREAGRRERGIARAAKPLTAGEWRRDAVAPTILTRMRTRSFSACEVHPRYGWRAWDAKDSTVGEGPETGPEGQRLADAALRAAGYVLADSP